MRVLTVNAGSSSLKLRVLDGEHVLAEPPDLDAAVAAAQQLGVVGVGHRVVHGGPTVRGPTLVDDDVLAALRGLTPLVPSHQPAALAGIERVAAALPGVPQVVCPDTAFHVDLPAAASTPALPADWRRRWGLRRYGFHGLSVAHACRRVAGSVPGARRVLVAHLGAGASLTAVLDGRSVDTTMGFTPVDGLVMATRCGAVDPGTLLWLLHQGVGVDELTAALETGSGLTALAGTGDMAEVERRADSHDPEATLALGVYAHRLRALLAAMVAALGGLDVLALTGGVGENSVRVREAAAAGLAHLGVQLDADANRRAAGVRDLLDVTGPGSSARVLVVRAREDLEIARGVREVLGPYRR